jgi:hypothetical protein
MIFEKNVKKMDLYDIGLIKLSVLAFVLFVLTIWPSALNLALSLNPWIYFVAFAILAVRPFYNFFR